MKIVGNNCIYELSKRYPVLYVPISEDINLNYKETTLKGNLLESSYLKDFITSENDYIMTINTEVGNVDVVFLYERHDFELFLMKTIYKCIQTDIPNTIGAMMISGINNWQKINNHLENYTGIDKNQEFKKFTSNKDNYKDFLLLISNGFYSNISPIEVNFEPNVWLEKSCQIRIYHECTHFICRKLWADKKNIIFDEIVADCIGLKSAFGFYDKSMAKKFLGFNDNNVYIGGRLEFYCEKSNIDIIKSKIFKFMDFLENLEVYNREKSNFDFLKIIMESNYVL